MGVTQGAGLSLKWFRDNFCSAEKETAAGMGVDPYYLMDQQAARAPIGCKPPDLPAVPDGRAHAAPRPGLRGAFIGLSAMHTKYDMLRAVMEGVTFSQRDSVEILKGMGVSIDGMLACGGGGTSKLWRQMLADTYNCAVRTVVSKEGPALGRRDPRRRRRRPVPLGAGGLPPRDPPESAAGSDRGERAEVRGLLPHVHAALPRAQGLLQGARRALIFRNTPHCAGSRRFPAQYLCMSNQRTTTS